MARGARKNRSLERHNNYPKRSYQGQSAQAQATFPAEKKTTTKSKPRKRGAQKQKVRYVYSDLPGVRVSMSIYVNIALIFLCALATLISFANVSLQRNYNQNLSAQLRYMEAVTTDLGMQVLEARNLEEIEQLARTRLGMSEPNPHQIIYINVDMQSAIYDTSYVVEHLVESFGVEESWIERVSNILISVKEFLLGGW